MVTARETSCISYNAFWQYSATAMALWLWSVTGNIPVQLGNHCIEIKVEVQPYSHTHAHTRLTALFPGLAGWAGTRKVKPIWILLKQETVSGTGISWAICKSAPRSRQITMPAPHHSIFFTGRMPFLPPNQQRQSSEGTSGGKNQGR